MSWLNPNNAAGPGNNLDTGVAWVTIATDQPLTPTQLGFVHQQFARHKAELALSLIGLVVKDYKLPDGTRMQVISNSGQHRVTVWPAVPKHVIRLPHGFAVKSNWANPGIYGRRTDGGVEWGWKEYAPQVSRDTQGYDQVLRPANRIVLPLVLNVTEKFGWDWDLHSGYQAAIDPSDWLMPVNLVVQGEDYQAHRTHFALNDTLVKADGTELYAVAPSPAILFDPESQVALPGTSDSSGEQCALQHYRVAPLTDSIWKFRFCNEVLHRIALEEYEQLQRNVVEVVTPLAESTGTSLEINDSTLDESAAVTVFAVSHSYTASSSPPDQSWGFQSHPYDVSSMTTETEQASREILQQTAGTAETTDKLIAVGGDSSIAFVQLENRLDYPRTVNWRMGYLTRGYGYTMLPFSSGTERYGRNGMTVQRRDMKYWIDGAPDVRLNLGWKVDYKILEGTTTGRQDGRHYKNTRLYFGYFPTILSGSNVGIYVEPVPFTPGAVNIRESLVASVTDPYNTGLTQGTEVTTVADERPTNSGSYDLTSRYVIDYDHRGRFIAAIKVRVQCEDATWVEDQSVYEGYMKPDTHPTYTVDVWLETDWNGTVAATLLCSASGTHPAWEFLTLVKGNPYYYPPTPADISAGRDAFYVYVPPVVRVADDAIRQMVNLAVHQGVNPHLACQDIRSDLTEEEMTTIDSAAGIEYSVGDEQPHTKRVTGQLYARTFNIASDFPEALWLLHATKVSAKEDDGETGDDYFYFDGLKAALELDRHVEVRDGVHVQWSDTLGSAESRPAATARELELFQV